MAHLPQLSTPQRAVNPIRAQRGLPPNSLSRCLRRGGLLLVIGAGIRCQVGAPVKQTRPADIDARGQGTHVALPLRITLYRGTLAVYHSLEFINILASLANNAIKRDRMACNHERSGVHDGCGTGQVSWYIRCGCARLGS